MKKNAYMIGAAAIFAAAAMSAFGQAQQSTNQPGHSAGQIATGRSTTQPLPEWAAKIYEAGQLDKSAAAALDAGDYPEAEADARQSLSLSDVSGLSRELFAQALYEQGKTEEALAAYKMIADEGGAFPRNLLPYALLLLKTGHYAEAVAAYNKALPLIPDTLPEPTPIQPDHKRIMELYCHFTPDSYQPKDLETAINVGLGLVYETASWGGHSQLAKSLAEYEKAVALEPDSALAHIYYAAKLNTVGQRAKATAEFKKAAELGSGALKAMAQNPNH